MCDRSSKTNPAVVVKSSDFSLSDRVGCAHVDGKYNFTDKDYLNEGADEILALGMGVIKVFLSVPDKLYPFNSDWPRFTSLVETVRHRYFRQLFDKPFSTFILVAFSFTDPEDEHYYMYGVSDAQSAAEEEAFYELAKYLLTTYRGTGKTFVIQNWEGDWSIRMSRYLKPSFDPTPTAIKGMIRWMNSRQAGVTRARDEVQDSDVKVYNACEVNLVLQAMKGRLTVTNDVLPYTNCDLYSYSSYDSIGFAGRDPDLQESRRLFCKSLDYLASKAPDSEHFGARNIYIGEFGWPSVASSHDRYTSEAQALRVLRVAVEESLGWGCRYLIYWQVYENETRSGTSRPQNSDCRGFYLIKPDGRASYARDYFASLLGVVR
jgi:hypothetical protein